MLNPLLKAIHLLLLAPALLLGLACLDRHEKPIALATSRRIAYEPLHLARQMGGLNEREVRLVEMPGSVDCLRALKSGLVQGAALTLEEACSLIQEDDTYQLALVMGISKGSDAMVSRKKLDNLSQLKGMRIGMDPDMVFSQLLGRCLEKAGLKLHDIQLLKIPLAQQENAFEKGEVDVLVSFDPGRTRLLALGGRVIFDSREIAGEVTDVLVVKKDPVLWQGQRLEKLRASWFKALEHLSHHPGEALSLMTRRIPMDRNVVQGFFQRMDFPDSMQEARLRSGGLESVLRTLSGSMVQHRVIKKDVASKTFFDQGKTQ